jgi:hypothetical protein
MGYRIRVVPEVETWLAELRDSDPGAADLVNDALDLLREGGHGLGPPVVVPAPGRAWPGAQVRPDLDHAHQRQFQLLTQSRRSVADIATERKRLELQIQQLEEAAARLAVQLAAAGECGGEDVAVPVRAEASAVAARVDDLRRVCAAVRSDERRAMTASMRLQQRVDDFRIRKEAVIAAEASVAAADLAVWAEAMIGDVGPAVPELAGPTLMTGGSGPAPDLNELRPGAPERTGIRILFTVRPPGTAVLLGAGTERDWLNAWYAEMTLRCRDRYERDQGSTG